MGESPTLPPTPEPFADLYRRIESSNWLGWIDKDLDSTASHAWLERPRDLLEEHTVECFKRGRNVLAEVRWPVDESNGNTVVLKEYCTATIYSWLCALVRSPRAIRAWDRAFALIDRGFNTPRPLWLMLASDKRASTPSYLAVETAPPHTRLREILGHIRQGADEIALDGGERLEAKTFLSILGGYVRSMHDAGVWHRDFSGGNLLIPNTWRASDSLAESIRTARESWILIDVNRARLVTAHEDLSITHRIQDLERIAIPAAARGGLYDSYAAGRTDLEAAKEKYLRRAVLYRRLRQTHNPAARLWRKVFTYRLRFP